MKNSSNPVCELETFNINKLHVECLNSETDNQFSAMYSFDYNILCQPDNPRVKKMIAQYSLVPNPDDAKPRCPYAINVEIEGVFSFPEDMPEEKMGYLCRVNGLTILYGILRGELANVTGSFKGGKFILPTVMMQDVVKDVEARKAKSHEATLVLDAERHA
jgi:hypothetical protein